MPTRDITINPWLDLGGTPVVVRVQALLVDAAGIVTGAFVAADGQGVTDRAEVLSDASTGEDLPAAVTLPLTPTDTLDRPTSYQFRVTDSTGRRLLLGPTLVQVPSDPDPENPTTLTLADLLGLTDAVARGDILVARLLPDPASHSVGDTLALDADLLPAWGAPGAIQAKWDDLRAPASMINPAGSASPPDAYEDGSLLFAANAIEQIAVLLQMPHAWAGTDVRPHIHWCKTTDAAGDVIWELRHRVLNKGEVAPAWSAWAPIASRSETIAADQRMLVDRWADIDMSGAEASSMLSLELRRNGPDGGDTYAADARLWELDVHYQVAGFGSVDEYPA